MSIATTHGDEIVTRYRAGESTRSIACSLKVGRTSVISALDLKGVSRRATSNSYRFRKNDFDQGFFSSIDSARKAYWLGFVAADGHVSDDGLNVTVHVSDADHMSQLATDLMSAPNTVRKRNNVCRFDVYSQTLVRDLRTLGLFRNKSFTLSPPSLPEALERHFIRGLFDGDGSIKISNRRKSRYVNLVTEYTVSLCGTHSVMSYCRDTISLACFASRPSIRVKDNLSHLEWGGRQQVIRILDWLYSDSDRFLQRKRDRWLSIPRALQ